jgi:hypothetical protein
MHGSVHLTGFFFSSNRPTYFHATTLGDHPRFFVDNKALHRKNGLMKVEIGGILLAVMLYSVITL